MQKKWCVIYIKAKEVKKVARILNKKNIKNYCPQKRITTFTWFKKKISWEPFFRNFMFIHISDSEAQVVRKLSSVVNFVYWLGNPVVMKEVEIENMMHFFNQFPNIKLEKTGISSESSHFIGEPELSLFNDNKVVVFKNSQCKLWLPSIGYVMVADIDPSNHAVFDFGFKRKKATS